MEFIPCSDMSVVVVHSRMIKDDKLVGFGINTNPAFRCRFYLYRIIQSFLAILGTLTFNWCIRLSMVSGSMKSQGKDNVKRLDAGISRKNKDEVLVLRRVDWVNNDAVSRWCRRINPDLRSLWSSF